MRAGVVELHGWQSRYTDLEHPDRLLTPLIREEARGFQPIDWGAALDRIAREIQYPLEDDGRSVTFSVRRSSPPLPPVLTAVTRIGSSTELRIRSRRSRTA